MWIRNPKPLLSDYKSERAGGILTLKDGNLEFYITFITKIEKNYKTPTNHHYNQLIDHIESLAKQYGAKKITITGDAANPDKFAIPFLQRGYTVSIVNNILVRTKEIK